MCEGQLREGRAACAGVRGCEGRGGGTEGRRGGGTEGRRVPHGGGAGAAAWSCTHLQLQASPNPGPTLPHTLALTPTVALPPTVAAAPTCGLELETSGCAHLP